MSYLSIIEQPSDGSQRVFQIPFSFLKKEYISAWRIDPETREQVKLQFSWLTDSNTIELSAVVPKGFIIRIERNTEIEKQLVSFKDPGPLS